MASGTHLNTLERSGRRRPFDEILGRQFVRTAKKRWRTLCMVDSTGRTLTFGRALAGGLLLSRWIQRHTANESSIGLLLPASVGGALANVATTLAGKTAVNLNFTAGREGMTHAVERCGIRTILTSRVFLSKAGIEPMDGMVFLEDILKQMNPAARVWTWLVALLLPAWALNRMYVRGGLDAERLAAVIFSSGSTGVPKGVMLTHRNVLSNIDAIGQIFDLTERDVIVGVLPFFHSFGFTGTLWFPLVTGFGVAYHPNPMDAKTVGELAGRHRATFLISTPTFCSAYVRKCSPEQFAHLRYAIVGAEKLREPIARAFKEKFGLDLLEGYGCTEMAPVVAVNVPTVDNHGQPKGIAPGSVGRPIPGVVAKVVDPETGEGPLFGKPGMLLVNGPNRMVGYLGDPAKTAEVILDGWYVTGDIAMIDEHGCIYITDRLSRFSKIAGEMVPHMKVEDVVNGLLGDVASVVTAVPDESKGERLVVFYTTQDVTADELWSRLSASDLPKLWVPKKDSLHWIEAIPTLGTGKVDLRKVKALALERVGVSSSAS